MMDFIPYLHLHYGENCYLEDLDYCSVLMTDITTEAGGLTAIKSSQ